ncbi:MAG: nucleotidyl transferase AbiEii/AbiGii toxin family protein [Prochlorothrix sp.]
MTPPQSSPATAAIAPPVPPQAAPDPAPTVVVQRLLRDDLRDGSLSIQEFMNREVLPLATIQAALFEFLQNRSDFVIFGAQAVNAYGGEPRMTQNIDLLSTRAQQLAEEIQDYLREQFYIAVRIREVKDNLGYRVYQVQKAGNRHLVDIRQVDRLPNCQVLEGLPVIAPVELIVSKVVAYDQRRGKPKAGTDWRDLAVLLLRFPELKVRSGVVEQQLLAQGAREGAMALWQELVAMALEPEDEEDF